LYEKRELDTPPPDALRSALWCLQDIFAILFLAVQPSLANLQVGVDPALDRPGSACWWPTALVLSRYVPAAAVPQISRARPETDSCSVRWPWVAFLIGEIAEKAASVARKWDRWWPGVVASRHFPMRSTSTAKVTTLRDFFITLFFVALGMTIPDSQSVG